MMVANNYLHTELNSTSSSYAY